MFVKFRYKVELSFYFLIFLKMSDVQIFQVAGLLYFSIGVGMLFDVDSFRKMYKAFAKDSPLMFITGFVALVVGYLIVVNHNIWAWDRVVLITIIGWMSLIKGELRIM